MNKDLGFIIELRYYIKNVADTFKEIINTLTLKKLMKQSI